ncbi:methionyl-tRNA formyltransferase [Candidatus Peregrinibacteria bacterium]|nr:MAG: methionyl-tRNA formyltransferase [Candidatus Peregrinibacteria bacterium]
MNPLRLLFFSSSPISLPLFRALLKDKRFEIMGLFCQPDKPAGRGQLLTAPETKLVAETEGILVHQMPRLSEAKELLDFLKKDPPDFLLTFAYGQILSSDWLELPRLAPLNVHASLLPLYRGAAPIQAALLDGQKQTGLSLMKMTEKMDEGPVAFKHPFDIEATMNSEDLFDALGSLAAERIPEDLLQLKERLVFEEQDPAAATYSSKIKKEDASVDFHKDAETLLRQFRAYTPWPGLWTTHQGQRLKFLGLEKSSTLSLQPGELSYRDFAFYVGTQKGDLKLTRLQLEGKKPLEAKDFILGFPDWASTFLGT